MKKVLIITPHVPHQDRTAGDWRIYSLATALTAACQVSLLPLKIELDDQRYIDGLKNEGLRIVPPGCRDLRDLRLFFSAQRFDTVIFEWFHSVSPFIRFLPLVPQVIIDTHELQFMKLERSVKLSGKSLDTDFYTSNELAIYKAADILIAITENEKNILRTVFPRKKIAVMPTGVDVPPEYQGNFEYRSDIVFFASFFGSRLAPNFKAVDFFMRSIFPSIKKGLPGARFHVLGSNAGRLRYPSIIKKEDIIDIPGELGKYRIFVCPLQYGAGMKKKILDAAASGTPVVTTSIGIEGIKMKHDKEVIVADTAGDFAGSVVTLYRDVDRWNRLSRKAYSAVRKYYGRGKVEQDLLEMIQQKCSFRSQ